MKVKQKRRIVLAARAKRNSGPERAACPGLGRLRASGENRAYPTALPAMITARAHTPLDHLLTEAQRALDTVFGNPPAARPNPAGDTPEVVLEPAEARHAAGLMRINHVGEVCAQGLYFGQAAVARDPATRAHLLEAAQEETDHLSWCADRLRELDSRPSLFNPLWYAGSYTIGTLAGLRGDGWNLGFVVETERQVEAHLDEHLQTLPPADQRSREILKVMKIDEARHAEHAEHAGARKLPFPIPSVMALASKAMKAVAYRV